jgi:hypothetical protein
MVMEPSHFIRETYLLAHDLHWILLPFLTNCDDSSINFDGSSINFDGSPINFDGSPINFDGSSINFDGSITLPIQIFIWIPYGWEVTT